MPDIPTIRRGSRVQVRFALALEDDTIVEGNLEDTPDEITVGESHWHEALERRLLGLKSGEKRVFVIPPEQGFGWPDPQAIQTLARDEFPKDMPLEAGTLVEFTTPGRHEIVGCVLQVLDAAVEVDFNHPLAGHTLMFTVEILKVAG